MASSVDRPVVSDPVQMRLVGGKTVSQFQQMLPNEDNPNFQTGEKTNGHPTIMIVARFNFIEEPTVSFFGSRSHTLNFKDACEYLRLALVLWMF